MINKIIILIYLSTLITGMIQCKLIIDKRIDSETQLNNEVVVGVLSQETSYSLEQKYPGQFESYIAASYVKYCEGGGARVVPIWIGKPKQYYRNIMRMVNGVLFPGGATWFNQSNGYADAGRHIYDIAVELNKNGSYFPLWGTCLGFELLTYLAADNVEHREHCSSQNQGLHLDFKPDFQQSRMFKNASKRIIEILSTEPVTSNFHQYCVTERNMSALNLDREWRIMSTNRDWNGLEFISTIEHKTMPFYGIQFHPEKNIYEWVRNKNISHTANAIRSSQYFADFFINECRKNFHRFPTQMELDHYVIYNYPTTFTGLKKSSFEECYMFDSDINYRHDPDEFDGGNSVSGVKNVASKKIKSKDQFKRIKYDE
uniref:folate gamma-glutamyl hydrolase n=1 Tax=Corethrella appendiculata TaxID=1370023 RepID=U5EYI6_9DIPT